jgi:hypothetical protein
VVKCLRSNKKDGFPIVDQKRRRLIVILRTVRRSSSFEILNFRHPKSKIIEIIEITMMITHCHPRLALPSFFVGPVHNQEWH